MSCLQNPSLSKEAPRRDAGLLWDLDKATQTIVIRRNSDTPFEPSGGKLELLGQLDTSPIGGEQLITVSIFGKVARQYSPLIKKDPEVEAFFQAHGLPMPKRPRSRLQPVQPESLNEWLIAKLERLELKVHDLDAQVIPDIRLNKARKRESVPAASFKASVSGRSEAINAVLEKGLGRAKNFGLGLIQIQQNS